MIANNNNNNDNNNNNNNNNNNDKKGVQLPPTLYKCITILCHI